MNSAIKQLAKKARNRLKSAAAYSSENKEVKQMCLSSTTSYMVVAHIRRMEDDPLFSKVRRLMEREKSELIVNPLASLIDKNIYEKLPASAKEKYMLKLSKKYNQIKNYILSGSGKFAED
jgi:hypothetical protein